MTKVDHDSVIEMCDIGLSDFYIKMGYSFTSMERFYTEKDLSKISRRWKNFHGPMNTCIGRYDKLFLEKLPIDKSIRMLEIG